MRKAYLLVWAAIVALAPFGAAHAQTTELRPLWGPDRGRNESVAERPRPDYQPAGVRLGAIVARPGVGVDVGYDDNIFYQPSGETEDLTYTTRARLGLETDWSRHGVNVAVGLDDYRFQDNESEHHTDPYVEGQVRIDIQRASHILIGGRQARLSEARGAPDAPAAAAKPVRYEVREAYLGGLYEFSRFRTSLRVDRQGFNFKDAPLLGGGVREQDDRDYVATTVTGRVEYALSPDAAVMVQASGNERVYELAPPRAAFDRNSTGSSYTVGFNTDIGNLVRGEAIVGYLQQDYEDSRLGSPSGLAFDGKLEYFASPLATVTLAARRRVEETLTGAASAFLATNLEARVDYEFRRNVLLFAGLAKGDREFEGIDRHDDLWFADTGARILLNRRVELGAVWRFEKLDPSGAVPASGYDVNRFVVSANFRL